MDRIVANKNDDSRWGLRGLTAAVLSTALCLMCVRSVRTVVETGNFPGTQVGALLVCALVLLVWATYRRAEWAVFCVGCAASWAVYGFYEQWMSRRIARMFPPGDPVIRVDLLLVLAIFCTEAIAVANAICWRGDLWNVSKGTKEGGGQQPFQDSVVRPHPDR